MREGGLPWAMHCVAVAQPMESESGEFLLHCRVTMQAACICQIICELLVLDGTEVIKAPSSEGPGFVYACPPGFGTQMRVTTVPSTGGGRVSCVQSMRGVSRWFTPLACDPCY